MPGLACLVDQLIIHRMANMPVHNSDQLLLIISVHLWGTSGYSSMCLHVPQSSQAKLEPLPSIGMPLLCYW